MHEAKGSLDCALAVLWREEIFEIFEWLVVRSGYEHEPLFARVTDGH